MDNQEITLLLGFVVLLISCMAPIVKLITLITKQNTILEAFQAKYISDYETLNSRVTTHGKEIEQNAATLIKHEERIKVLEKK